MCTVVNEKRKNSQAQLAHFRCQINIKSSVFLFYTVYAPLFHVLLFVSLVLISLFSTIGSVAIPRTFGLGVFRGNDR